MVDKEYYADCVAAHKYCSNHKSQLMKDKKCGCFYCTEIFSPNEITEWIKDTSGTAICPYCGIDSIIGESRATVNSNDFHTFSPSNIHFSVFNPSEYRLGQDYFKLPRKIVNNLFNFNISAVLRNVIV